MAFTPHHPKSASRLAHVRLRLWGEPGADAGRPGMRVVRTVAMAAHGFLRKHLQVHAASLSFYLLLSVVPFLAFLFLVLKAFRVHTMLRGPVLHFLVGGNAELMAHVSEYIENAQSGMLGGVGVLITFAVGFVLLQRVKLTLNLIWEVDRPIGYRSRLIEYVTVMAVTPLLLTAAFSVSAFLGSERVQAYLQVWEGFRPVFVGLAHLSGYVVMWLLLYYAYTYLPDARVRWWAGLTGALAAGVALVVAQNVYVAFLFELTRQNLIYGALALLPSVMVWFYLGWTIFLLGAELSCVVQRYRVVLEHHRLPNGAEATHSYLVIMALVQLHRHHVETGKPVPLAEVARRLNHPRSLTEALLGPLLRARLIMRLPGDRAFYVPLERMERLTLREALERTGLLPVFAELPPLAARLGAQRLLELYREANESLREALDRITIHALAEHAGRTRVEIADAPPEGQAAVDAPFRPGA